MKKLRIVIVSLGLLTIPAFNSFCLRIQNTSDRELIVKLYESSGKYKTQELVRPEAQGDFDAVDGDRITILFPDYTGIVRGEVWLREVDGIAWVRAEGENYNYFVVMIGGGRIKWVNTKDHKYVASGRAGHRLSDVEIIYLGEMKDAKVSELK